MSLKFIIAFTLMRPELRTESRAESVIHLVVIWWLHSAGNWKLLNF